MHHNPICQSGLYRVTTEYWKLSHAWRGHLPEANLTQPMTMGDLISGISNNYKAGISSERLCFLEVDLLQQVINNKRCKKTKPINNIVHLHSQTFNARAALLQKWA